MVTRPVLFQVANLWNKIMGKGLVAQEWIKVPDGNYDLLGKLLEEITHRDLFQNHRVGSRYTPHTKCIPSVDQDGNFYVRVNANIERRNQLYDDAERSANAFVTVTKEFLQFCDEGKFHAKEVGKEYTHLDILLQEAYDLIKQGRRKEGEAQYNNLMSYIAERQGVNIQEIKTRNRMEIPTLLVDDYILEAVVGTVIAESKSTRAREEMEKEYTLFKNPYSHEESTIRHQFTCESGLKEYRCIAQWLGKRQNAKKYIAAARILHEVREENNARTRAYNKSL